MHRLSGLGLCLVALTACDGGGPTSDGDSTDPSTSAASSGSSDSDPTSDGSSTSGGPSSAGSDTGETITSGSSTGESESSGSTGAGESSSSTGDASESSSSTGDASESSSSTGDSSESSDSSGTSTGGCESDDRAVKLGKLVDPADGGVIEGAIVVVHDDRVAYVGTDEAQIPCGAEIVDWSAYTGIPGLVDAHTHFVYQTDDEPGTFPWTRSWWLFKNHPDTLAELSREAAEKVVKLGVTTAIDKGAGPGDTIIKNLRDAIAAGEIVGPRIYTAGYGISGPVPSIAVMKQWINQNVAGGADLIKLWADSCSDDTLECTPNFTFEQLKAAVDEAHLLGKPIAIHAYHADTAKLAIMAGPDSMEHPEGLDAVDFMDMIAMDITYVPTIDHNRYYKDNLAYFGYDPSMAQEFADYIALNLATANQAHVAGVKIAMGSDAVFSGFGENKRELEWFIEAGMSPLEALRAATIQGAASIGVEHEVGRVAVGYFADIVAVEGDPLADIDVVIHQVQGVMKSGRVVEP